MFRLRLLITVSFFLLLAALPLRAKDDWLPITPADLSYKDPGGAPAVILYLQDDGDDTLSAESFYIRTKVLTDEGKKYGDVELPYLKDFTRIDDIKARVIQPDGSITNFDGKVYDKVVVKSKTVKIQVRAFTLPAVQPGSILEYRYKLRWNDEMLLSTVWRVQRDLLVKKAHFSLKAYLGPTNVPLRLSWVGRGFPSGVHLQQHGDTYALDMTDIPPFPDEQYAPPEDWMKMMVRFVYTADQDIAQSPDEFWRRKSIHWQEGVDRFLGKHSLVDQEAAALVQPADTPEVKLRKLYARSQQIRNTTYEREKTEKETKHDKAKENSNADDVLKHGYGTGGDINGLFLALARSAGFDAGYVHAAPRDQTIFDKSILDAQQLSAGLVLVKLPDKQLFLDPGTLYCPFGLLSWEQTGVSALTASKTGGEFLTTTEPRSADAVTVREAALHFAEGRLDGTVKVSFKGLEALRWRLDERDNDETARRKDLEDEVARTLPAGATIDLTRATGWTSTDDPLVAEFKVSVPGAVTATGKRLLMPIGLFQGNNTHPFEHAERKLPVYFSYPFREVDDVTVELPAGLEMEGTPEPKTVRSEFALYQRVAGVDGSKVHIQRRFVMEGFLFLNKYYSTVRTFYDRVRVGDEDTLVLRAGQP